MQIFILSDITLPTLRFLPTLKHYIAPSIMRPCAFYPVKTRFYTILRRLRYLTLASLWAHNNIPFPASSAESVTETCIDNGIRNTGKRSLRNKNINRVLRRRRNTPSRTSIRMISASSRFPSYAEVLHVVLSSSRLRRGEKDPRH